MRVRLKAIRTGRLVGSEQRVKGAGFWRERIDSRHNVQTEVW